ncbi:SGNH/GDSL hydrolase family protein [Nocardioides jiangxiensis]|uniref:SGNH/GDSL hydrolase family protein n=1 Tax=Nocardioides jiangxiensis TaxID=3064524 RepID=A0ABT9AYZ8_9ACTN|nr:SGNH/GDSL hydrolase family protein [Nocardioides sp. WY-20]MDO7867652.1 SGNH/GDSL hydrolase family protein [Nocardioides sp. WY-20]
MSGLGPRVGAVGPRLRIAVVVVVLSGFLVVAGAAWSHGHRGFCQRAAEARSTRAAIVTGAGQRVLVIGDSWSAGRGLEHVGRSWPRYLPGRVHVDGFSGSGFSRGASPCAGRAYADRVDQALLRTGAKPDLVVLEGGLNEYDRPDDAIRSGVRRVLARLADRGIPMRDVVVVGPVAAPARAGAVPRVDRVLSEEAARDHVRYLSVLDLELPYLPDRLHLTEQGHEEFGKAVAALL